MYFCKYRQSVRQLYRCLLQKPSLSSHKLIPTMLSSFFSSDKCSKGSALASEADYVEGIVCNETDIKENEMKNFDLADVGKVLLVKQNGKFSAIGAKCSHYGAMLSTGALGEGRVRCPWHGACFNLTTGDIEDFPGQDSVPCYQVSVEKGQVKVRAKKTELETNRRSKTMAKRDPTDERTFVVIGGGPSAAICVETLRQEGFTGRIVMICKEPTLPYDRIKLSKKMELKAEENLLRSQAFYDTNDIETMLGVEVTKVNSAAKEVICSNGYELKYDKLYVATGSRAKKAPIPNADLKNVVVVRTHADVEAIHKTLTKDSHVVVLGVSFIGLEAAAYCSGKVTKITVIGRDTVPLKPTFGEAVGGRVMEFFQEKGVEFRMKSGIKQCIGDDSGTLTSVELVDGEILKADVCIMGTGSALYTEFLQGSGVDINKNGSIDVNQFLSSNISDIYVGGDVANAPVYSIGGKKATIGHYPLAQYHGHIAGLNMAGKRTELKTVPFFWCMVFGKSFRYSGYGQPHDVHIEGDLKEMSFVAFYLDANGNVIGIASCGRDPIVAQYAEFVSQGKTLHKSQLSPDPFAWTKLTTCETRL